ncbi:copper amine oxidase N-terminal domain-containing protein [Chengkuizengella sediminis]|uniref:copper amine oxidase N-terminal domain-containing protein n=1 Tax=Chengkuizengella sediminis TaxID=1885917 RepID=UPI001389EA24|nr:copper amine oxidase N-terminal domain-containing protein [Chengkuizengella sediminis]NDI35922.1 copper amine oxidase N-terminal domain-containing protein [Chengkuizengella sediminis]
MNRFIKNVLFIGALVIIISSIAAVMALGDTGDGTVSIMNEDVELVEITPGNHAAMNITNAYPEGNKKLTFNFDKGFGGQYGFQPGSYYTWDMLFKITNKTEQPLDVKVEFNASNKDWVDSNLGLKTKIGSSDLQIINDDNQEFIIDALASNEGTWVDLTIAIPRVLQSDTLNEKFTIIVSVPIEDPDNPDEPEDEPDKPNKSSNPNNLTTQTLAPEVIHKLYLYEDIQNGVVDDKLKRIDPYNSKVRPFVLNDRMFLPMRFLSESLGASVHWNSETDTVTIMENGKVVRLVLGEKAIWINGEAIEIDVAPIVYENRTFLPVRHVATALDKHVDWYEDHLVIVSWIKQYQPSELQREEIIKKYFRP